MKDEYYKIRSDISIPNCKSKYPFKDMEVGQSFLCPMKDQKKIATAASKFSKAHPEYTFTIRKLNDETFACWRIK